MLLDDVLTRILANSFQRLANTILKLADIGPEGVSADELELVKDFAQSIKQSMVIRQVNETQQAQYVDPFAAMFGAEAVDEAVDDDVVDQADAPNPPSQEPLS